MGREQKADIWETKYFTKFIDKNKTRCELCTIKRCKQCKSENIPCELTGTHATNARKHLKSMHQKEFTAFEAKHSADDKPGLFIF